MEVKITSLINPFSFFCISYEKGKNVLSETNEEATSIIPEKKTEISDVSHGQYIAVLWQDKWARGVVSLESQFLIWLIDYGIFIRPSDKTVYVPLPPEYKKYATKVFEASIHGVIPVDKIRNEECQIENTMSISWSKGAIEKAKELLSNAFKIFFNPVALISTNANDIVIGDLYIMTKEKHIINIVDELSYWPVFLQKNKEDYIKNISAFYTTRRRHRACILKPAFQDTVLSTMSLQTTFSEYCTICANVPEFKSLLRYASPPLDGSTVVDMLRHKERKKNNFRLTPSEIEKYSNMYIKISGRELNMLNVLTNKMNDLTICERYKDHDKKSVGRANVHRGYLKYKLFD